jgi:hypothetical protein
MVQQPDSLVGMLDGRQHIKVGLDDNSALGSKEDAKTRQLEVVADGKQL